MTTLAANSARRYETGDINEIPVIASDIIFAGAAVGVVDASGHARPLTTADRFVGFATAKADNSDGSAADINVEVQERGKIRLSVTGAEIQDVTMRSPVYASDDDTFSLDPSDGQFIGFVHRFISSGVCVVDFNASGYMDPWWDYPTREQLTGTKTFDAQDTGKLFCVTAAGDGDALTLPAIAAGLDGIVILAVGGFGTTALTISPNSNDAILAPDLGATADKDLILTKATQRRGDFVELCLGDADGYTANRLRGTYTKEA